MPHIDPSELRDWLRRFSNSDRRRLAFQEAAEDHANLIRDGMDAGGVDPVTGQEGIWPPKRIPRETPLNRNRKRRFIPRCTLQDTGRLWNSIKGFATSTGWEVGPDPLAYAAVHQFGVTIAVTPKMRGYLRAIGFNVGSTVTIPPRPYIVFPDPWRVQIGTQLLDDLTGAGDGLPVALRR